MTEETDDVHSMLIKSVVDFTGVRSPRARKLLEESNWDVPEAVTRFFAQVDASHPRRPTGWMGIFESFIQSIKSCMGWAAYSCWSACKFFIFGSSVRRSGESNLHADFSSISCLQGSFLDATRVCRDNRKVLLVFLHSKSAADFDPVVATLCNESISSIIETQFAFWAGDTDCWETRKFVRAFPIRATPALLAVISINSSELKIVAGCSGVEFTVGSVLTVLSKAQEAQDGLIAEDEQFRMNRDLREVQDREYQEALARDAKVEELRAKAEERKSVKQNRTEKSKMEKKELAKKFSHESKTLTSCMIVVKLPNGARISRKFATSDVVGLIYDWVLCCGLLHPESCADLGNKVHRDNFVLATSFPSLKLTGMHMTLLEAELVPNAVLVFNLLDDDEEEDISSNDLE